MANGLEMMLSTEVELLQAENARLREQLAAAQAKQEPVAWMVVTADDKLVFINANQAEHYAKQWELEACPLFAAPVVQPQQEPVGKPHRWNDDGERCLDCGDKDWMADKYCSAAPVVQEKQEPWPFSADRVTYHKAAPVVQPDMIRPDQEALQQIIAAALYDFGGFITTRQKQLVASATDNAADTVEALKEFMEKRGINPCQDVPVLSWQCWIAAAEGKSNAVADSRPD